MKASARQPFVKALDERVLVADGAMGTMLYARGVFINRCFDELNLSSPRMVRSIHDEYVRAGADIIETNTFGANRMRLAAHGLADRMAEINREGARLARASVSDTAYVAGSIGPLGIRIEPWGPTSLAEARAAFAEQGRSLVEGGVDLFLFETFSSLSELEQAVAGIREVSDLPVVAQLTVAEDGVSLEGTSPEHYVPRIEALGVEVLGLNCGLGPQPMLEAIERVAAAADNVKLSAMPNAGLPRNVEGRNIYLCSPEYMASYARRFFRTGVRLVGGCCGTTPEHVRAIKDAVRSSASPARATSHAAKRQTARAAPAIASIPLAEKSPLGAALSKGKFITSVCLAPPRGWDVTAVLEAARRLGNIGVDCLEIPEDAQGAPRLSSIALAALLTREAGMEAILEYSCWGRHLGGMQADLLGAYALGVRNILARTGEPSGRWEEPERKSPLEVDAVGLTNMIRSLNEGHDLGGNSFGAPTGFCIGVAVSPSASPAEQEIQRFRYKVEAGAEFAITRPVFDVETLKRFLKDIDPCRTPILVRIIPLVTLGSAEFMQNEVPGVSLPPEIIERMRRADSRGQAHREGVRIARETLAAVSPLVQGIHLSLPAGHPEALPLMEEILA
ncbi:MAG: bifunctional homocysteine S-methyltransferase/methylenetetrahydrofolate reductase [Acidobacteriota bacterium]